MFLIEALDTIELARLPFQNCAAFPLAFVCDASARVRHHTKAIRSIHIKVQWVHLFDLFLILPECSSESALQTSL